MAKNKPKTSTKKVQSAVAGKVSTATARQVTHEDVARRAYELWLADGCVHGRHEEHWTRAERELAA